MSDPFYTAKILKWRRNPYTGDYHAQAGDTKYRIVKTDAGSEGKGWLVHKKEPERCERYLRPLVKTVKKAQERAEVEAYWDQQKRQLSPRAEADASDVTILARLREDSDA